MKADHIPEAETEPLLSLQDLTVDYPIREGVVRAVDGVSLDVYPGELTAVVGESGCGKSTLAYSIIRQVPYPGEVNGGQIVFDGQDVLRFDSSALRRFRWRDVAFVFQAAQNTLNPVMRVADQMIDTVAAHNNHSHNSGLEKIEVLSRLRSKIATTGRTKDQALKKARDLLEMVRLEPERVLKAYPFELSGGMRQRVIIALSLLLDPQLLVLDEPTTALDVVTQVYILDILTDIQKRWGLTMLMLTHDMAIVARVADRVAVMYAGQMVEEGTVEDIYYRPRHPYTRGLIHAAPSLIGDPSDKEPIPGSPPSFLNMPAGCRFHPRCSYATEICEAKKPVLEKLDRWRVACHHWREISNKGCHDG